MNQTSFCPASMCPLFAANGSPWTGEYDAPCEGAPCGFWSPEKNGCTGCDAALSQLAEYERGVMPLQLIEAPKATMSARREYDCPRASDCQWQRECGAALCPPRAALANGLDPRLCAY